MIVGLIPLTSFLRRRTPPTKRSVPSRKSNELDACDVLGLKRNLRVSKSVFRFQIPALLRLAERQSTRFPLGRTKIPADLHDPSK